jgi:hypothetical protein
MLCSREGLAGPVALFPRTSRPVLPVGCELEIHVWKKSVWLSPHGPGVVARCPIWDGLTASDSECGEGVVVVVQVAAGVGDVGASGQA